MLYKIAYDLHQPGRDYTKMDKAVKQLVDCVRVLESTWLVDTRLSAGQIRDHLKQAMDANDSLLVSAMGTEVAWYNIRYPEAIEWLRRKLNRAA